MSALTDLLTPISELVPDLDLADSTAAERRLNERFPPESAPMRRIREEALRALRAGEICERGEPGMKWGRIGKPEQTPGGSSIDAVHMSSSAGPPHAHPNGEVCLCLPEDETSTFEGRRDTWVVMPAGSRHAPTVESGSMLILYWLPDGAVAWG